MPITKRILNTVLLAGLASSASAIAQQPLLLAALPDSSSTTTPAGTLPENSFTAPAKSDSPASAAVSTRSTAPNTVPTYQAKFERWVDLKELSFSGRYRNLALSTGWHDFDNGQQRSLVDGAFKFDNAGKYKVGFRVSSGKTFNWAYTDQIGADFVERNSNPKSASVIPPALFPILIADTIADPEGQKIGSHYGSRGFEMYARQLFLSATPVQQVTFEYGGLGIDRGVSTEATTYDDDGYIAGERLRVHDSKNLYFDEISFTNAYEGDVTEPNFFKRGNRLAEANYRQAMLIKTIDSHVKASADYTFDKGTHTIREAAFVKLPNAKIVDSARVELYQRLNSYVLQGRNFGTGQGVAVTGSKTLAKRFQLDGGYANIDVNYGVLTGSRLIADVGFSMNGDAFLTGERIFTRSRLTAGRGVDFFGYYTHQINVPALKLFFNKQGITGGMTIDFKKLLFPGKATH